jgi:transposase InsO family protein
MLDYFEMKVKYTPYRSPWKNGILERFLLSLKKEVFEDVIPINVTQVQRVCLEYQKYYNESRPHQEIERIIPGKWNESIEEGTTFLRIQEHLGGKINSLESEMTFAA